MATHLLLSLLLLLSTLPLLVPIATVNATTIEDPGDTDFIGTSCQATLYPDLCVSSLSRYAGKVQRNSAHLARTAIAVALIKAHRTAGHLSRTAAAGDDDDSGAAPALRDCSTNLRHAVDEIRGSLKQMRRIGPELDSGSVRFSLSNVRTWMSAALTDEETCVDGFEGVGEGPVKTDVCDRVTLVKKFTSNALALVNSFANKETGMP